MKTLVIGIGNVLLSDEGLGVHVARALLAGRAPRGMDVLEAGTSLFEALQYARGYDRVILADAIRAGGVPGTVYQLEMRNGDSGLDTAMEPLSLHEFGVAEALHAGWMLGLLPEKVRLIGVEPATTEPGLELSPAVRSAVEEVLFLLLAEFTPRE